MQINKALCYFFKGNNLQTETSTIKGAFLMFCYNKLLNNSCLILLLILFLLAIINFDTGNMSRISFKYGTLIASKITDKGLLIIADRLGFDPYKKKYYEHSKIIQIDKYSLIAITGVREFYNYDTNESIFNINEITIKYLSNIKNRDINQELDLNILGEKYIEIFKRISPTDIANLEKYNLNLKRSHIFMIHLYKYNYNKNVFDYYSLDFSINKFSPSYIISPPDTLKYNDLRFRGYGMEAVSASKELTESEKAIMARKVITFEDTKNIILKIMFIAHKKTKGSNKPIGSNVDVYLITPSKGIVKQEQNYNLYDVFE